MATTKHFVFIEDKKLSKREINQIEKDRQKKLLKNQKRVDEINELKLKEKVGLKNVYGKVVISINLEGKNSHTFSNGQKIYIGRQFNNLNRRETEPVNAITISSDQIPQGAEILIHPNAINDSNKIHSFIEDNSDVKYYSIPEDQCYLWKNEEGEWLPLKGFVTALRVFEPYNGTLLGIEPKQIKNVLYITSGELKEQVVHTLKACDYEIIFMGNNGYEERIIRCRHYENEVNEREEIIAIDPILTKKALNQELLVGISSKDAKYIIFTL
jgi:hypothetical protein